MHPDSVGGSGRDEPSFARMLAAAPRMNPPENEIPAAVAIHALLARSDDVAIALIGGYAYTVGLRFELIIRLRREPHGSMVQKSELLLSTYAGRDDSDEQLLLGVEYADGRTATNFHSLGPPAMPTDDGPNKPFLSPTGGSGGGRSMDQWFWLTPLPPAGPLLVACAWSGLGIPESQTVLDGAAINEAGSRAMVLWPPLPTWVEQPVEPVEPRVPNGGWFDKVRRAQQSTDQPSS